MKNFVFIFFVLATTLILFPALTLVIPLNQYFDLCAQTEDQCTEQLNKAEEEYQLGNWDQAIALINNCLKKPNLSEDEKGRAYRILGLTYIATQLAKEANEAVRNLLIMVPNYKINPDTDPPALKEMVDDMAEKLKPKILGISPVSTEEGAKGFTLQVIGENFVNGSLIRYNGAAKATTYISITELRAEITEEDIQSAGKYVITVYSPIRGGRTSNEEILEVKEVSSFPWTWVAAGAGAVAAGVAAILLLGNGNGDETETIADPPGRP
jgi:tetratricopeptide (TPR) repeat protein